jgi:hypothetical protein
MSGDFVGFRLLDLFSDVLTVADEVPPMAASPVRGTPRCWVLPELEQRFAEEDQRAHLRRHVKSGHCLTWWRHAPEGRIEPFPTVKVSGMGYAVSLGGPGAADR